VGEGNKYEKFGECAIVKIEKCIRNFCQKETSREERIYKDLDLGKLMESNREGVRKNNVDLSWFTMETK
jgi:hypothetical protein